MNKSRQGRAHQLTSLFLSQLNLTIARFFVPRNYILNEIVQHNKFVFITLAYI